jgi:hemolysin III
MRSRENEPRTVQQTEGSLGTLANDDRTQSTPLYMARGLSKDGSVHVTDEVYNTWISVLGAVLTVVGTGFLLWRSQAASSSPHFVAFLVYGLGVLSVFVTSALHHGVNGSPRTNHVLRELDYAAIFLMIAGTFTPFCMLVVKGSLGTRTLVLIWALAALGISAKLLYPGLPKWATVAITVGMGWLGLLVARPIYQEIHLLGLIGLLVGGVLFTVGGLIFALEKPNPVPGKFGFHEIWHCCVVAGAASHYFVMHLCF